MSFDDSVDDPQLPYFLQSFENLTAHFDEHFGSLGSNERGDSFLDVALRIIPLSEPGQVFPPPKPSNRRSHDGGVDISAEAEDGRHLFAQSKYKIREKADLDSIFSKFKDFEDKEKASQESVIRDLFTDNTDEEAEARSSAHYFIVTSSKLEGILRKYETSSLASKPFFEQLQADNRITIIDGPHLLKILQNLYRQTYLLPSNVSLVSPVGWLTLGNVYLGVVHGGELADLYKAHGDALFFENIRDFIGIAAKGRQKPISSVNTEISATIVDEPLKMLGRNNGVTFRAQRV